MSADRAAPHAPDTVHLVGAGPEAPDLLTLRAARLLERALRTDSPGPPADDELEVRALGAPEPYGQPSA